MSLTVLMGSPALPDLRDQYPFVRFIGVQSAFDRYHQWTGLKEGQYSENYARLPPVGQLHLVLIERWLLYRGRLKCFNTMLVLFNNVVEAHATLSLSKHSTGTRPTAT